VKDERRQEEAHDRVDCEAKPGCANVLGGLYCQIHTQQACSYQGSDCSFLIVIESSTL
jgi:hypothetical protein